MFPTSTNRIVINLSRFAHSPRGDLTMKIIFMTGAAGGIGKYLRPEFKVKYALRLSDREPINTLGEGESFVQADLNDLDAICAAAEGVDGILHYGVCAGEAP